MQGLAESDRPQPSTTDFKVDDVVLAFHGSLLYEARVLDVESEVTQRATAYLVHFQGWKKSWDEKVSSDLVFEHNDGNLRIAHRLLAGARMRQQALQPVPTEKDDHAKEAEVPEASPVSKLFQIPPQLQRQLVDDWEFITKEKRLVPLPRPLNVQELLLKWIQARRQSTDKVTREVAEGLQAFFDAALHKILLYRFERLQYNKFFNTGTSRDDTLLPSAVYGAEHLLRLLLKLPFLLDYKEVGKEKMEIIAEKANELAKYMQRNGRTLFVSEYEPASEAYIASQPHNS